MTNTEKILAEFDEKFKCIQGDCDGNGIIPHQVGEGEWEAQQCQFHAEYLTPQRKFLATSIAQAVAQERKRIGGVIEGRLTVYYRSVYSQDCSHNETEEEKRTEMIKLSDVVSLLSALDKPLTDKE